MEAASETIATSFWPLMKASVTGEVSSTNHPNSLQSALYFLQSTLYRSDHTDGEAQWEEAESIRTQPMAKIGLLLNLDDEDALFFGPDIVQVRHSQILRPEDAEVGLSG